jgi:hypothetical protein
MCFLDLESLFRSDGVGRTVWSLRKEHLTAFYGEMVDSDLSKFIPCVFDFL